MVIFSQLYIVAIATLIFVLIRLIRARRLYRFKPSHSIRPGDEDLPTISVCLPARNETNAMTECLESVLASNYPKLEVIVLDDNSNDNTSHLIKAFAHAGVRFIKGDPLPDDWLGKNYALETLLGDVSGKYVLFMDVDTRLSPDSISLLVVDLMEKGVAMSSVIPQRYDMQRLSAWFGTLRYFWELVLSSRVRPGASSAVWIIERQVLQDELGGLGRWRDEVQPELHLAAELAKTQDYSLIISTPELGIHYAKKWLSQIETARRLLLPRFYNSTLSVLIGLGLLITILLPQAIVTVAIISGDWSIVWVELIVGVLAGLAVAFYCRLVWVSRWWIGLIVAPYTVWQEFWLLISSAVGYRLGTITWKGRLVARPVRKRTANSI